MQQPFVTPTIRPGVPIPACHPGHRHAVARQPTAEDTRDGGGDGEKDGARVGHTCLMGGDAEINPGKQMETGMNHRHVPSLI